MTRQTNWNIYLQVELLQVHIWGNSGSFWFCNLVLHQIWVSQYFHKMSFGLWCYKMGLAFSMPILRGWRGNRISLATELEHYALWIKYCSVYGIFAWFDQNEKLDTEIPKSPLCLLLINAGGMTSMWPLAFFFFFPSLSSPNFNMANVMALCNQGSGGERLSERDWEEGNGCFLICIS